MSATDQALKTSYTQPIPQWYNPATGVWEEATGTADGGGYVQAHAFTLTDRSVTGTGAAVDAAALNTRRRYLLLQAPDTNGDDVWVSLVGTADAASPSLQIKPGGGFEWANGCPSGALSVLASSGDALTAWEG